MTRIKFLINFYSTPIFVLSLLLHKIVFSSSLLGVQISQHNGSTIKSSIWVSVRLSHRPLSS